MPEGHLKPSAQRKILWEQMSQHWLDTESRHRLPQTAYLCLESGYGRQEVRDIWRYEVTPAVWRNLYIIGGNWLGWDRDGLADMILRRQVRPAFRGSWLARVVYRCRAYLAHADWLVLENLMSYMRPHSPQKRHELCADLSKLALIFFEMSDSANEVFDGLDGAAIARLRRIYETNFLSLFEPVLYQGRPTESARAPGAARLKTFLHSSTERV